MGGWSGARQTTFVGSSEHRRCVASEMNMLLRSWRSLRKAAPLLAPLLASVLVLVAALLPSRASFGQGSVSPIVSPWPSQ